MKTQYIISIIILALSAAAALAAYLSNLKKESKPKWTKPGIATFTALFLASAVFLSLGAATNEIEKPKPAPAFDPSLSGYLENIETPDGLYTGEFSEGYYHGEGKLTHKCTSYCAGDWRNNVKEGQGEQTYYDAQGEYFGKYTGSFSADKRNGQGIFTYANGYTQSGEWKNDNFME
jgi:hypothetical protein